MAQIRHSAEQIIGKLCEAEVLLGQELKIPEISRRLGVTGQTYYRWRKGYGGLKTDQAKKLKELVRENARLKELLAEAHLDRAMLQEVASGKF